MDIDIYTILSELAKWVGWPLVALISIVGGAVALWITNQRVEHLKEMNDWLKTRLADAENFTPSALVERYASKHKLLSDELELLYADYKANEQRIKEIESEKKEIAEELDNIASSLFKALEACSFNCLFCSAPNRNIRQIGLPIKRDGERFIVDIETICQGCGHKTISISKAS
jgi:hypothetical protein